MPYPEEMVDAARPEPPSWWPVVGWTFFLGVPGGGVGAPAGRPGVPDPTSPAPYWVACHQPGAVLGGVGPDDGRVGGARRGGGAGRRARRRRVPGGRDHDGRAGESPDRAPGPARGTPPGCGPTTAWSRRPTAGPGRSPSRPTGAAPGNWSAGRSGKPAVAGDSWRTPPRGGVRHVPTRAPIRPGRPAPRRGPAASSARRSQPGRSCPWPAPSRSAADGSPAGRCRPAP